MQSRGAARRAGGRRFDGNESVLEGYYRRIMAPPMGMRTLQMSSCVQVAAIILHADALRFTRKTNVTFAGQRRLQCVRARPTDL